MDIHLLDIPTSLLWATRNIKYSQSRAALVVRYNKEVKIQTKQKADRVSYSSSLSELSSPSLLSAPGAGSSSRTPSKHAISHFHMSKIDLQDEAAPGFWKALSPL